ncbi:MAG: hypothetical protein ACKVT0_20300, partial [Planctomycetaceae bacterium]
HITNQASSLRQALNTLPMEGVFLRAAVEERVEEGWSGRGVVKNCESEAKADEKFLLQISNPQPLSQNLSNNPEILPRSCLTRRITGCCGGSL